MPGDLSPATESFIQQEIAIGAFHSREDALEAGVSFLKKRRQLINRLAESRRQLDAGESYVYDQERLRELFEQLISKAENRET